jgi:hypothetical protein
MKLRRLQGKLQRSRIEKTPTALIVISASISFTLTVLAVCGVGWVPSTGESHSFSGDYLCDDPAHNGRETKTDTWGLYDAELLHSVTIQIVARGQCVTDINNQHHGCYPGFDYPKGSTLTIILSVKRHILLASVRLPTTQLVGLISLPR